MHYWALHNNSERKSTSSYYTPDYIVLYIVKETIGPLCEGKSSQEIRNLKVCDPAMGSGHFLHGALNFLTKKYLDAWELEKPSEDVPTTEAAKIDVLDCLFGVDINPRAVKLEKMSLWLESAHPGKRLENLGDQIKCANALDMDELWKTSHQKTEFNYFDSIIGNPLYVDYRSIPLEDKKM